MTDRAAQEDALADRAASVGDFRTALTHLRRAADGGAPSLERWLKMAAMARATGDAAAALDHVHAALAIDPLDLTALLLKATILHNAGDPDAGEAYGRAVAQAPTPLPPSMAAPLTVARARHDAWRTAKQAALLSKAQAVAPLTPALEWFVAASLRLTAPEREGPTHYCYPGLATAAFHPRSRFEWLAALEAAAATIRDEYTALMRVTAGRPYIHYPAHVPVDQWQALNDNADWSALHLIERGSINPLAARHCPQTMALLGSLPQPAIPGIGPNAMFSLLAPHTHIPPHTGITNTRLVCHLPLVVPEGCWFRVGDDRRAWREGVAWVFDDTIDHEAMNPTDLPRAVLIFDIWHPDLD